MVTLSQVMFVLIVLNIARYCCGQRVYLVVARFTNRHVRVGNVCTCEYSKLIIRCEHQCSFVNNCVIVFYTRLYCLYYICRYVYDSLPRCGHGEVAHVHDHAM